MTIEYLVLATDLSTRCDRALDRALQLAAAWSARLVVVHAIQTPLTANSQPSWHQLDPVERARKRILAAIGDASGATVDVVVERRNEPVELVLDVAARPGCGLIITGEAREETIARMLLGTTLEALARRSPVPVLEVKSRPHAAYEDIVVATDFSGNSRSALETVLALFPTARITVLHAYKLLYETHTSDTSAAHQTARREAQEQCQAFIDAIPAVRETRARIEVLCEFGDPGALLADMAEIRPLQLVVLGTAGRSGLSGLVLGSTAIRIASEVPTDILLVRQMAV